jgi:hypothetical protein
MQALYDSESVPYATSVCGLKLLVYASSCRELLVYAVLVYAGPVRQRVRALSY